jgi:tetratricopeptide (TPR) repeat protein
VEGNPIHIPDPNRPTLLVLLGPQQLADDGIIKAISTAATDTRRAQVVLIECGPSESPSCDSFPWPVVADPDRKISSGLDVHGWPTVLVLQSDGLEVARIGGCSESLALKLGPYLELAARTVDRAAVERKLTTNAIVGEGAGRDLLEAQRSISDKKPNEALKLLGQAIERRPESINLRLATARALIDLGRDDEAKNVLRVILDHSPDLPEAHYLMGLIHEHAGDWQAAAKHYRAAVDR